MTDAQLIYEALYCLPRGALKYAVEVALAERDRYAKALAGIASCATRCGCCELHARVARMALADVELADSTSAPTPAEP